LNQNRVRYFSGDFSIVYSEFNKKYAISVPYSLIYVGFYAEKEIYGA
jgi:hypothetical protein